MMAEIAPQYPPRPETAADELHLARVLARRTMKDLADFLGKDPKTIARWESNDEPSEPTISEWRKIAEYLHAPWLNGPGGVSMVTKCAALRPVPGQERLPGDWGKSRIQPDLWSVN